MSVEDFKGDIQAAKRELFKLGLEQGHLTLAQLEEYLPAEHLSDAELEVLRFSLQSMGIELRPDDAPLDEEAGDHDR